MIEKLVVARIDGTSYLCVIEGDKLTNAKGFGKDTKATIEAWIVAETMGELVTVRIAKSSGFTEKPLSQENARYLKRQWEDMQEIKKTAMARLAVKYFEDDND